MLTLLLCIYIGVIMVRPQEWVEAIYGFEIVNATAIVTLLTAFPTTVSQWHVVRRVPEFIMLLAFMIAVPFSLLPIFWLRGMIDSFQTMAKMAVPVFLILLVGRKQQALLVFLWVIILSAVWMVLHSHLQVTTGVGFGGLPPLHRPMHDGRVVLQVIGFGIFADPNDLCLVFIAMVPILLAISRSTSNTLVKITSLLLSSAMCYGAWLTNSRGGVIGMMGMAGAYAFVRTKGIRRWIMLAIGCSLIFVFAPARFEAGATEGSDRLNLWGDCLTTFQSHPIFGTGYQNLTRFTSEHSVAHNSYFQALAELGLVGYIPFFLFIFFTLLHLWRAINMAKTGTATERHYLMGLFSAVVGYLTAIFFLTRNYNLFFYILLTLGTTQVLIFCKDSSRHERVFGYYKKDIRLGLICCAASIPTLWVLIRLGNLVGRG